MIACFLQVDLLGDEVEALTDLLAKIYIALDHYSPVLQYYTGVSILFLVHLCFDSEVKSL